LFVTR